MDRNWFTAESEYQGSPILFRRPNISLNEFEQLSAVFPFLLIITHDFARIRHDGLPEQNYNDSLMFLDEHITSWFKSEQSGIVFLVETFSGRRTYYIYVGNTEYGESVAKSIVDTFPSESLAWKIESDKKWRLAHGYAKDFHFFD